jgi:hypothetical protein
MSDKFMIGSNELPEIVERDITELKHWEDNPRTVQEKDMQRLIEQIKLLGVYKPLLINQDNIILGGNMRFEALKKLGVKKTLCSLVKTDNPAQMMDYALSDNDQIGVTDEQKIAEFVALHGEVKSELFAINSSPMQPLNSVLAQFKPDETQKVKSNVYSINIAFNDLATLENCLVEIQNVCEDYEIRGISVNDGSKQD